MALVYADVRGLAEHTKGVSAMKSLTLHAGLTFAQQHWLCYGDRNDARFSISQIQAGKQNASPLRSTAQHIRAFFAAMATMARQ